MNNIVKLILIFSGMKLLMTHEYFVRHCRSLASIVTVDIWQVLLSYCRYLYSVSPTVDLSTVFVDFIHKLTLLGQLDLIPTYYQGDI